MRNVAYAVFLFAVSVPLDAANAFCPEPSEPSCLKFKFSKWDEFEFEICKSSTKSFLRELEDWKLCLSQEADERARKAIAKFNCYARGDDICF